MVVRQNCKNIAIFFAILLQFVVSTDECAKILQNFFAKCLQFGLATISEKNIMHFNFKAIYAWHFYGTRRGFFQFSYISLRKCTATAEFSQNLNMLSSSG